MKIPTFTHKYISQTNGEYSDEAQHYNDLLNQQLNENVSDDGFVMPNRNTDEIEYIFNPANPNKKGNGTILYDQETHELKVLINGVIKVFTLT